MIFENFPADFFKSTDVLFLFSSFFFWQVQVSFLGSKLFL